MGSDRPLDYAGYLRLTHLLAQLSPRSPAHDESLFITVHQSCELWFRQILIELTDARDKLLAGDCRVPRLRLRRCHSIERLLLTKFDVLDTMAAPDFVRFRDDLGSASGAQSAQFHEIELLSGRPGRGLPCPGWTGDEDERLRRRAAEPTLWDGFLAMLGAAGFPLSTKQDRLATYLEIARDRDRHAALWELAEALVEHDQTWSSWRVRHSLTVERQIGTKHGTGGTTGGTHLAERHTCRFYPELWEFRALL